MATKGSSPQIVVLDVGMSLPIGNRSIDEILGSGKMLQMDGNGKSVKELAGKLGLPDGVDICNSNQRLYWTDMGVPSKNNGRVMSCKLDGSDMKVVIPRGSIHTPKQIIIDQSSDKIYVSDREGLRVFRCDLDGSNLEIIVKSGDFENDKDQGDLTKWCVGIAVSAKYGKFYWTQKGLSKGDVGRIFSANIDMPKGQTASNRQDIECLLDKLPEPIDLEIDEATGSLYWTDRGELPFGNTLNKIHLDKSGNIVPSKVGLFKHEIVAQNFNEAIGLKLDVENQIMYVSDFGGAIYKCDLQKKTKERIYEDENAAFTGLLLLK